MDMWLVRSLHLLKVQLILYPPLFSCTLIIVKLYSIQGNTYGPQIVTEISPIEPMASLVIIKVTNMCEKLII